MQLNMGGSFNDSFIFLSFLDIFPNIFNVKVIIFVIIYFVEKITNVGNIVLKLTSFEEKYMSVVKELYFVLVTFKFEKLKSKS